MKVLIHIEDVLGVHYATSLELAALHLRRGDEVHLLVCHGSLQSCPANKEHDGKICTLCRSKLRVGLDTTAVAGVHTHVLDLERYAQCVPKITFATIDELKAFSIDGVNHGMEAASSVISGLRDPRPDMNVHRALVERNLFTSITLYRAMLDLLTQIRPDMCYVLNGRRASQMPAVRALRACSVRFSTFEVGHSWKKYILIDGTYFHDLPNKKREIEQYWSAAAPGVDKEQLGHEFYRSRRYGSGDDFPEALFKRNQRKGVLPKGLDPRRRNVAIFNSSEDEFAAVEGYHNPVYKDQIEGLQRIISDPAVSPEIQFYLRIHPNLAAVSNFQTRALEELQSPNLTVIRANEDIDSYALMESAEKVLTFGSAMSVESAYAGKPSILIGREPYEDLGSSHTPRSHAEALALINDPGLPALDRLGALKYGYYMVARDVEYQLFDPVNNTFSGRTLEPSRTVRRAVMIREMGVLPYLTQLTRRIVGRAFGSASKQAS